MNTLSINELIDKINSKKNGRIGTIEFYSKKTTIDKDIIYKVTKTQFHKVDRTKVKDYVEPATHRIDNSTYIVDGWLKEHNKTHNKLLWVVPFKSKCHKTLYYDSQWNPVTKEYALAHIQETSRGDIPSSYTVNAEQVVYYK